jgi:hypothetical protein
MQSSEFINRKERIQMCHASVTAFNKTPYSIQAPLSRSGCMWYSSEVTQRIMSLTLPVVQFITIWVVCKRFQLSVQQCSHGQTGLCMCL